eukprot:CAMPEP_0118653272 /NCGR_PEP_ID=MMETSP0785-20121206/11747_1 /TAXON_ID=91992 /ORGANISM="Bolidomonas pacifica, Strain CCMP 1866" /LENGTH=260 /DNA_ID=CAMNT_0006545813 /DNA_START=489 /DNA_END=1268 /DNA_ORIENTATION=+
MVSTCTRRLGLATIGFTILSWSHNELTKKRKLGHLPLPHYATQHNLPPALPDTVNMHAPASSDSFGGNFNFPSLSSLNPYAIFNQTNAQPQQEQQQRGKPTLGKAMAAWRERSNQNKMAKQQIKRTAVYAKLLRIQSDRRRSSSSPPPSSTPPLGYALVTGASRGIGRAISVELARHGIDVVLVSRDSQRLRELARDIRNCYGVETRVVEADLAKEPERVYRETKRMGIKVEMLINNAGISDRGLFASMDSTVARRIIDL